MTTNAIDIGNELTAVTMGIDQFSAGVPRRQAFWTAKVWCRFFSDDLVRAATMRTGTRSMLIWTSWTAPSRRCPTGPGVSCAER